MGAVSSDRITHLLEAMRAGQDDAAQRLFELVYGELRAIARRQMANVPPGDTLQPTALVNEAYLRLFGKAEPSWNDRRHFLNAAARSMRDILVEQARRHASQKRGGDRRRVPLDEAIVVAVTEPGDLLALDEALGELERSDRTSSEVLMLRHFAGLTAVHTAQVMEVSRATVDRHWRYARAWLHRRICDDRSGEDTPDEC